MNLEVVMLPLSLLNYEFPTQKNHLHRVRKFIIKRIKWVMASLSWNLFSNNSSQPMFQMRKNNSFLIWKYHLAGCVYCIRISHTRLILYGLNVVRDRFKLSKDESFTKFPFLETCLLWKEEFVAIKFSTRLNQFLITSSK